MVVRLTAGSEVRQKYRFIAQESLWLERLLMDARQHLSERSTASADTPAPQSVTDSSDTSASHSMTNASGTSAQRASTATLVLTPRALVALWGRLLSSTRTARARRRAKAQELATREALAQKLRDAALQVRAVQPDVLEEEIATRRPVEAAWMHEELSASAAQVEESLPAP
jgi:hypothetical protein